MNYYCTLFDSNYLTRGLALYDSLVRSGDDFRIIIFCFDELCFQILGKLNLDRATLVPLTQFETEELKKVKMQRTTAEYCWTCTPQVIDYSLVQFGLPEVTYLDADLYFFQSAEPLFRELGEGGNSVLITEHRYTPRYDQSAASGKYCVQFITFKADQAGRTVLDWWRDRCMEWCYARYEDGKFGDQKYLDDWTTRFQGVHVLAHLGGGVAPWNVQQYRVGQGPSVNGIPVVFYHFHHVTWNRNKSFDLGGYELSQEVILEVYLPYLDQLEKVLQRVRTVQPDFEKGMIQPSHTAAGLMKHIRRRLFGAYNVIRR